MAEKQEAKPCPFCGSRADAEADMGLILCSGCGFGYDTSGYDTEAKAIKAWNRRAYEPRIATLESEKAILEDAIRRAQVDRDRAQECAGKLEAEKAGLEAALISWQDLHDSTPVDCLKVEDIERVWNEGKKALSPELKAMVEKKDKALRRLLKMYHGSEDEHEVAKRVCRQALSSAPEQVKKCPCRIELQGGRCAKCHAAEQVKEGG